MTKLENTKRGIKGIKAFTMDKLGRTGLKIQKHSPEILMVVGVAGVVTSTVMACRATLRIKEVTDVRDEKLEMIHGAQDQFTEEEYSQKDFKRDLAVTHVQTAVDFMKLYGPAVAVGSLSVMALLGSHRIMKQRNIAIGAAYQLVSKGFDEYRERVIEEFGEDKDRQFKYGVKEENVDVETTDKDGKVKKSKKTIQVSDPNDISQYAKFFDEGSTHWTKTPEYNLTFLKTQQNYANDLLKIRGHVFLNEVYDMLGLDRTKAGAVVGWVISDDGDNFIDFGMYDIHDERKRAFVNGIERSILLDFNVDGVIYDKI